MSWQAHFIHIYKTNQDHSCFDLHRLLFWKCWRTLAVAEMSSNSSIIWFSFSNHEDFICQVTGKKKHSAECYICKATFTETAGTTSNFHRHLEQICRCPFLICRCDSRFRATVRSWRKNQFSSEFYICRNSIDWLLLWNKCIFQDDK